MLDRARRQHGPPAGLRQQIAEHPGPVGRVVTVDEHAGMRSRTAVTRPPTAAATTGVPQACASIATRPNDSLWLGTATMSAAR